VLSLSFKELRSEDLFTLEIYHEKLDYLYVCCAPSMQPPQRMHIASVMKKCSGYELAVIVMNPLYTLPLTSHHNNKDVYKGATL
jgi:hypothetical protein